ncbi:unnamed protein product, partial [Effrenium voratum]
MCLCLLGIALALLVQPSTESLVAAQDFARGVPGLKEHEDGILAQFSELPAGASRLHFGSFRQNGTRCMPESLGAPGLRKRTTVARPGGHVHRVVAEADRVLEDNGTVKETKAVLRRWSSTWAKATKKGLEEDSHKAQVTSWHPGRGGVASRASPQQDSGAEDWLAKSCEEVEGFKKAQVPSWAEAVLIDGGLEADDEFIQRTVTALRQQGVTGKSLLELTLEKLMAAPYNIPGGPAELLTKKIQLLKEPQ